MKGAKALALPTILGQKMEIKDGSGSELVWKSLDAQGKEWFSAKYDLMGFDCIESSDDDIARKLKKYLRAACSDNSDFLSKWKKYRVTTHLEFPRDWGLGSSSTMIHCLALWAEANPFLMYFDVENGSGYDIACAGSDGPILYTLMEDRLHFESVDFNPSFKDQLYFVHLNKKIDSTKAVRNFMKKKIPSSIIDAMNEMTDKFCAAANIGQFNDLLIEHEKMLGDVLSQTPVKNVHFEDYFGEVKSLGAWGGDMVLATSTKTPEETKAYFINKGFNDVIPYTELILS